MAFYSETVQLYLERDSLDVGPGASKGKNTVLEK